LLLHQAGGHLGEAGPAPPFGKSHPAQAQLPGLLGQGLGRAARLFGRPGVGPEAALGELPGQLAELPLLRAGLEGDHAAPTPAAPSGRRSMMVATAWPKPMQRVISAYRPSRRSSSLRAVARSRVPEAPRGWPRAMAPPLGLTRVMSGWSSRSQARTTEAKASFTSMTSI